MEEVEKKHIIMEGSFSLLCHEDHQSCISEEYHYDDIGSNERNVNCPQIFSCDTEYEDDYVKSLVNKESSFVSKASSSSDYPSWLRDFRFRAVKWILNTHKMLAFRNQTAYLSISYLDQFLSIMYIDEDKSWAIRLLSVACLSLAAKMEECQVPALSQYPVSEFGFHSQVIKKMEFLVLSTFKWQMSLVTPFAYLHFFSKKLCDQSTKLDELISKSITLLMSLTQEIILVDYRPSVIAAAAVLTACDWQLTKETLKLKVNSVSLWETLDIEEQLLSCYSIMQRLSAKSKANTTPNVTEVHQSSNATPCTLLSSKRMLTFEGSNENPTSPAKISRK